MAKAKRGEGPNKMALVREAIDTLGRKAKPKAIHEHILQVSGENIPTGIISSYKSMILNKGKGKRGRKAKGTGRGPGRPPKAAGAASGNIAINDVMAVKQLVAKLGAKKISDIIHLLS